MSEESKKPKSRFEKLLKGCAVVVYLPIVLIIVYIFAVKMFYRFSVDLIGVPVDVIHTGINMPLKDVSPNGKYGLIGSEIYNFEEEELSNLDQPLYMFVNDRYLSLAPTYKAGDDYGEVGGKLMQLYDMEKDEVFSIVTVKASTKWTQEVAFVIRTGGEAYRYDANNIIVLENPTHSNPEIYLLAHPTDDYEFLREIPKLQTRECLKCLSPSGEYIISNRTLYTSNLNAVEDMAGNIVLSRELLGEDANRFFRHRGFSIIGWSADESGVYATYGRQYVFEYDFLSSLQGFIPLPDRVLYISVPLE